MKHDLFSRVALTDDLPQNNLRVGDVATVVEHHTGMPGQEPGYSLEVFNAVGDTVAVVTVKESQIVKREGDSSCPIACGDGLIALNASNRTAAPPSDRQHQQDKRRQAGEDRHPAGVARRGQLPPQV